MSRRRNRHHSLSNASRISQRQQPHSKSKLNKMMKSTAQSFFISPHSQTLFNQDIKKNESLYNKNISFFRDNFNQNDPSQLPFMSTLRQGQTFKQREPKSSTICYPFEAALKNTANQIIKKRISDFASKQKRLSGAFYRWHNKSGMNNKWGAEFECTLRDYGEQKNEIQRKYNSFIQPIVYNDIQERIYERSELICSKGRKSFKMR